MVGLRARAVPAGGLGTATSVSVVVALLMGGLSAIALARPEVYPVDARDSFVPNDAVNIVLGVPALLVAAWRGGRGSLLAMLAWPGALGYVAYTYIAYLVGLPFGWLSVLAALLVGCSGWGIVAVLVRVDVRAVRDRLAGAVPIRLGGWVVAVFGAVFAARGGAMLVTSQGGDGLPPAEVGVLVADLVVSVTWVLGGAAMIRRRAAGYATGFGLLVLANLLFAGLVAFLLVQPAVTGGTLAPSDLFVVAAMWPAVLVPGALFARGIVWSARVAAADEVQSETGS